MTRTPASEVGIAEAEPSSVRNAAAAAPPAQASAPQDPAFSQAVLARNVVANWAGHLVFIISGFIVPRFIDTHLGEVRLGIWDFGWSMVGYISLLTLGVSASTNRFVARYRATQDWDSLNRTTGSILFLFLATAALAAMITGILAIIIPYAFSHAIAGHVREARWVIIFLGLSAAVQMPLSVPSGIITGYQRYDLVNLVEGICQLFLTSAVIVCLYLGLGLAACGLMVLIAYMLEGTVKYFISRRLCHHLHVSPRRATRQGIREVAIFGGKLALEQGSRIILYQTTSMLVMFFLGPAMLAIYSRSSSLVMHALKLMYHFGRVFTPLASDLQARGSDHQLARVVTRGTRQSMLLATPVALVLIILGGPILRIWMGPKFAYPLVVAFLALGHLGAMGNVVTYNILLGLNRHGAVGVATVIVAAFSIGLVGLFVGVLHLGVSGAALGVCIGLTALNCFVIPAMAATRIHLSLYRFFVDTVPGPLMACVPFAIWLLVVRFVLHLSPVFSLLAGLGVGFVLLALVYWHAMMSPELRDRIKSVVTERLTRFSILRPAAPGGRR